MRMACESRPLRSLPVRRAPATAALLLAGAVAALAGGCGGGSGVQPGATVNVYLSVPLSGPRAAAGRASCDGARREAARNGGRAGDLRIRVVCLDDSDGTRPWALAAVGANARRAVQDSTAVAYIGELDPAATKFSETILEAAELAQLPATDGAASMRRVLNALDESGQESPRSSLWGSLEQ